MEGSNTYLRTLVTRLLNKTVGASKQMLEIGARSCVDDLDLTFEASGSGADVASAFKGCKAFEEMKGEVVRVANEEREREEKLRAVFDR